MFSELNPQSTQNKSEYLPFQGNGENGKLAWWLQIITHSPYCVYYFGPFESFKEAYLAKSGYIEDLNQEGAQGIDAQIRFDNPQELTIYQAS